MDDATKQKTMYAFIAFNITVVLYQILFNSNPFSWLNLILKGFLPAVVIAGIVFGVMHFLQR